MSNCLILQCQVQKVTQKIWCDSFLGRKKKEEKNLVKEQVNILKIPANKFMPALSTGLVRTFGSFHIVIETLFSSACFILIK